MEKLKIFKCGKESAPEELEKQYNDWIKKNHNKIKIIERKIAIKSGSLHDTFTVIAIFYKEKKKGKTSG